VTVRVRRLISAVLAVFLAVALITDVPNTALPVVCAAALKQPTAMSPG